MKNKIPQKIIVAIRRKRIAGLVTIFSKVLYLLRKFKNIFIVYFLIIVFKNLAVFLTALSLVL
jgi:hypothetical protein